MHKPESVLENEMHKILWDFGIQMDRPILVNRPDLVLIDKNKKLSFSELFPSSVPLSKSK